MSFSSQNKNGISAGLAILCIALLSFITFYQFDPLLTLFANDQGTDFIVARSAERGHFPLLGPPSHVGGRHLGPIFYWYVIAVAKLTSFDLAQAMTVFVVTKLIVVCALLFLIRRLWDGWPRIFGTIGLTMVLLSPSYSTLFRQHWHSNYLFIASSLAFGSALLTVKNPQKGAPFFLVSLTLLFLSHLSSIPVVVALIFVMSLYLWRTQQIHLVLRQKSMILAVCISGVLFTPTMCYELSYPSNILKLGKTHGHSHQGKEAGIAESVRLAANFMVEKATGIKAPDIRKRPYELAFVLILACVIFHALCFGNREYRWYIIVLLAPLAVTTSLLTRFKSPLLPHYFNSSIVVPAFLILVTSAYAASTFSDTKVHSRLVKLGMGLFLVSVLLFLPIKLRWGLRPGKPNSTFLTLGGTQRIATFLKDASGQIHPRVYARLASKIARNSYYYLLGTQSKEMEYKDFFEEIPAFKNKMFNTDKKTAHVLFCPRPYQHAQRQILSAFTKSWEIGGHVDFENCRVIRLFKKISS